MPMARVRRRISHLGSRKPEFLKLEGAGSLVPIAGLCSEEIDSRHKRAKTATSMNIIVFQSTPYTLPIEYTGVPPRSPSTSIILAALASQQQNVPLFRVDNSTSIWRQITRKLTTAFGLPPVDSETDISIAYTSAGPLVYRVRKPQC
jgi:hypothetical protein